MCDAQTATRALGVLRLIDAFQSRDRMLYVYFITFHIDTKNRRKSPYVFFVWPTRLGSQHDVTVGVCSLVKQENAAAMR